MEDTMKRTASILAALAVLSVPARAGPREDVSRLYSDFAAAQNARDLGRVRDVLLDSPRFLWVSDGKSIWGREATLERMGSFQKAEIWRVEPDLAKAVPVEVDADSAFLHLPLDLVIGAADKPDRLRFLVSVLGLRTPSGWRIAALFTTTEKPD
jgi:ketosteroid isomerase-like protein